MKILLACLVLLAAVSCKKNKCEKWRYYNECIPKNSSISCNNPTPPNYISGDFCGDKLDGVYPNATKVIREDADSKTVQHFVQKL